jgi:hypothetical protein
VICAGRALADCTEDEIGGHHVSLSGTGSIVRLHRRGALPLPRFLAGVRAPPEFYAVFKFGRQIEPREPSIKLDQSLCWQVGGIGRPCQGLGAEHFEAEVGHSLER